MPTADVNGQTLYYEVHGEGEPLLCVMGLSADTLAWALQVPAFAASHRTVIFDNRDVGQSSQASDEYEVPDMYGRPWAYLWEKYFEEGMERPEGDDIFSFD